MNESLKIAAVDDVGRHRGVVGAGRGLAWCFVAASDRSPHGAKRNAERPPRISQEFHPGYKHPGYKFALIAALGLLLAGCSSALMSIGAPPGSLPGIPKEAQRQPQPPAQG